ncbi:MAG TPA: LysE family translocator [Paracoccus sp. (in: a-proteobacteria)]|uniref:LysE family translocator n=1 Tax=uncultured Paracoccus sp. TaxID=189685 RepID=UPI0026248F55|nr:LysE family translocator [uncultured Paracoccus sp.]HMQ40788.1 LysE family translocator [Paracoccus sp. (in: a-proteobacteria)]HMR35527.1 LysE family translocator [Paracoccus sp. (in: a-proteobacteria)]
MIWDTIANIPQASLLTFVGGGLLLNLAPGQDVMFATACGLRGGPRAGALAGLGVGIGVSFHLTLATIGLGAVAAAYPQLLTAIKYLGAAYLLLLAWQSWHAEPHAPATRTPESAWRIIRRGALSNILNPKPVLFLLAFLPPFTRPEYGPVWQQILGLGLIFTVTGTLITIGYGVLSGLLGMRLGRHLGVLNRIAALILGGLALRLVTK